MSKKRSKRPQSSLFGGFRVADKKSKGKRYIHKCSFNYKSDAKKELERRRALRQNVIMRKYKSDGRTRYGIFEQSGL